MLWVAQDKQFGDSKTVLFLRLFHSSPRRTASDVAKQAVYNRLIHNFLSLKLGHANAAGLQWSCTDRNYWIEIRVSGFTENTLNFLEEVCSAAKHPEISNVQFTQVRSMVVQSYQNASKFPARYRRLEILLPAFSDETYQESYSVEEALASLRLDDMIKFARSVFENPTCIKILAAGDANKETAQQALATVQGVIPDAQFRELRRLPRNLRLRSGSHYIYREDASGSNFQANSVSYNLYLGSSANHVTAEEAMHLTLFSLFKPV